MKKVFIVHGFEGSPNGGWRPYLMGELEKKDVYACALSMPSPETPVCSEWVEEIERHVERNQNDEIFLVGHSLGVPAILRFLEKTSAKNVKGVVLVSGPAHKTDNEKVNVFLEKDFDFEAIKSKVNKFAVIHGDNDPLVPLSDAEFLSKNLGASLTIIKNGGHLNGRSGFTTLPEVLSEIIKMTEI